MSLLGLVPPLPLTVPFEFGSTLQQETTDWQPLRTKIPLLRGQTLSRRNPIVDRSFHTSPQFRGSCSQSVPQTQAGTEQTVMDHARVKTVFSRPLLAIWMNGSEAESGIDAEESVMHILAWDEDLFNII